MEPPTTGQAALVRLAANRSRTSRHTIGNRGGNRVHIVILAGGIAGPPGAWQPWLAEADQLIAANGGAAHALARGVVPDVVLGDLDSLSSKDRRRLEARGTRFREHPAAKDETDLELAVQWAVENGAHRITVLGALGGRLDHTLGNLLLLADPRWAGARIRLVGSDVVASVAHPGTEVSIQGQPGDLVSLLPLAGDVAGVHTEGLAWRLAGDTLFFGRTRGISNKLETSTARVRVEEPGGRLLIVHTRSPTPSTSA
jgi:thiamine pyrophosphokinase